MTRDGPEHDGRQEAAKAFGIRPGPHALVAGGTPPGFALVRSLDEERRVLNGFLVVRGARNSGVGLRAVQVVIAA